MSDRSARTPWTPSRTSSGGAPSCGWRAAAFWDEVEREVEEIDWLDFAEFAGADTLPIEPRPGFEARLRGELLERVRLRYSS